MDAVIWSTDNRLGRSVICKSFENRCVQSKIQINIIFQTGDAYTTLSVAMK